MNEIEEKFYKTFEINKKCQNPIIFDECNAVCKYCEDFKYPPITDRILLELIDILRGHYKLCFWKTGDSKCLDICGEKYTDVLFRTCNTLKNNILNSLICMQKENEILKHQVQSLFTECE